MQAIPACGGCDASMLTNAIPQLLLVAGIALYVLKERVEKVGKKGNGKK